MAYDMKFCFLAPFLFRSVTPDLDEVGVLGGMTFGLILSINILHSLCELPLPQGFCTKPFLLIDMQAI